MKHTQEEIKTIALKILKDIDGKYYRENCIAKITFHKDDEINNSEKKITDTWTISINSLFGNRDFLIISDETAEPIYYQNFNCITTEIVKKNDGRYDYKD